MHIDIYIKDPADTVMLKYPPGWTLKYAARRVSIPPGRVDPLDCFDRTYVIVEKANHEAYG